MKAIKKDGIVTIENNDVNTFSRIAYTKIKKSKMAKSLPRTVKELSDS
jgi:hypothetical protein